MRILIVAATPPEIAPVVAAFQPVGLPQLRSASFAYAGHKVDVLYTGVGMVSTAVWSTRQLLSQTYDLALNIGVCGSFVPEFAPGAVVHIVSERLSELGAEDGDEFITMQELKLIADDEPPYSGGQLVNAQPPLNPVLASVPQARGITVNTVHGRDDTIAQIVGRFAPQVESMEGAGFMYACLVHHLPFAEVRAVSNVVERRNRERWQMKEAIAALRDVTLRLLEAS